MFRPFKDSAQLLKGAGFSCDPYTKGRGEPDVPSDCMVIAGSDEVILIYLRGSSYSDNCGTHYEPAAIEIKPRYARNAAQVEAVRLIASSLSGHFTKLNAPRSGVPRSSEQEKEVLKLFYEFAQHVRCILPAAAAAVAAEEEAKRRAIETAELVQETANIKDDILQEIVELYHLASFSGDERFAQLNGSIASYLEKSSRINALKGDNLQPTTIGLPNPLSQVMSPKGA